MASEKMIYATAANGLTVRIPESRYPAWKAAQEKIKAGQYKETSQGKAYKAKLAAMLSE